MKITLPEFFSPVLLCLLIFVLPIDVFSQRGVTYEDLRQRSDQPNIYTSYLTLPSTGEDAIFMASFRIDYDLLPFRRVRTDQSAPSNAEFFSTARMNMEVFRGSINQIRRGNFESVARNSWADTAYAESFEETQSRFTHLQGATVANLQDGEYSVSLDLNRDDSERSARSRERSFTVPDFKNHEKGQMILLESIEQNEDTYSISMLNYGEYALYGQDYKLLTLLPVSAESDAYDIKIERLHSGSDTRTTGDTFFTKEIIRSDLISTPGFTYPENSKIPVLEFDTSDEGYKLAILDIPASSFPNVRYLVSVTPSDQDEPVATKVVHSRWIDMPVSLLNLNIAIEMMHFIVDDDELRRLQRGSSEERERKFREFWAERDPNPDTEFNQLMTEYYSRIDYAYDNFTTLERPGYESDQGRAYILYGQPRNKERTFPSGGPTREIWEYRDRVLVFEATSGFGDFRLVDQQRR